MKEKFLELVEEVKNTGIVEKLTSLYDASDKEGFKAAWQAFLDDNQEIFRKIKDWASEFKDLGCEAIFDYEEYISNPMEIAVCIKIIDDFDVSECELFEHSSDLTDAIEKIDNDFANAVADRIYYRMVFNITVENIFRYQDVTD